MDLGGSVLALGPDLAASISDPRVLQSIAAALIIGAVALAFGTWLARHVAMLGPDAPAGEVIGVGLGLGLLVLTAIYASAWSAGRSAFAPVAISFAVAITLAFRTRRRAKSTDTAEDVVPPRRPLNLPIAAIAGGGVFFLAIGLLYGATMAPSPRDGVQPLEFMDEAYYSILGRDLATGGTESIYLPAGFDDVPGLPPQTWYHWGEIWLAASDISIFGLAASHTVLWSREPMNRPAPVFRAYHAGSCCQW